MAGSWSKGPPSKAYFCPSQACFSVCIIFHNPMSKVLHAMYSIATCKATCPFACLNKMNQLVVLDNMMLLNIFLGNGIEWTWKLVFCILIFFPLWNLSESSMFSIPRLMPQTQNLTNCLFFHILKVFVVWIKWVCSPRLLTQTRIRNYRCANTASFRHV